MAHVLTHGSLSSLATLDAGDTIECYAVSRLSRTESFGETTPGDLPRFIQSEESEEGERAITVRKSAIAFRFKSRMQNPNSLYSSFKPSFELTLEYGPQRGGVDMDSETLPMILTRTNGQEDYNTYHKYVTWENEGKIYFESSIDPERWDTADYIAPITGSVLSKVLEHALEYTNLHPRYQPFEVYDVSRESVVIPSSSSEDFVWDMYEKMAQMFVDIRPILTPTRSKVRLHVDGLHSIKRLKMGRGVSIDENNEDSAEGKDIAREVVEFYENMYSCSNKILNADYELFLPKDEPTLENESIEVHSNTSLIIDKGIYLTNSTNVTNGEGKLIEDFGKPDVTNGTNDDDVHEIHEILEDDPLEYGEDVKASFEDDLLEHTEAVDPSFDDEKENIDDIVDLDLNQTSFNKEEIYNGSGRFLDLDIKDVEVKSSKPTNPPHTYTTTATPSSIFKILPESSTAAQATAIAKSQNAQQNLLSGVGPLITSAILPCLTSSAKNEKDTFGYLFVDSATYYRLNLTFPYLELTTLRTSMPRPHPPPEGKGSFVDWIFVLMIVGGLIYGMFRMLQHSGLIDNHRNFGVCLKRFLDMKESQYAFPIQNEGEGFVMDSSQRGGTTMFVGGGVPHNFGQDVIPPSMGGKMLGVESSKRTPAEMKVVNGVTILGSSRRDFMDKPNIDQEMEHGSINDLSLNEEIHDINDVSINTITTRISRDPDLVDYPNLVSRSKVALPELS